VRQPPPICIHSFSFFASLRFSDATQSLRCDGAEQGLRGLQGPAVEKERSVSAGACVLPLIACFTHNFLFYFSP
jgi:hypothetical protein